MKKRKPYRSIRKPNFIGGKKAFREFLEKNLVYPAEALRNKIQGTAHVRCEINDRGKVLKAESIHKLGYGLDQEAERLCLLMCFEDTTARGLKIKHTQTIKIPFVLPQQQIKITYHTTPAPAEKKSTGYHYTLKI